MSGEKCRDLGLYCLRQKLARPVAQNIGERIGKVSRLAQVTTLAWRIRSFLGRVAGSSPPRYAASLIPRRHQLSCIAP